MQYFLFVPEVGLVETYANKVAKYMSWYPEPASYAVDALKLDWQAIPPFILIRLSFSKLI